MFLRVRIALTPHQSNSTLLPMRYVPLPRTITPPPSLSTDITRITHITRRVFHVHDKNAIKKKKKDFQQRFKGFKTTDYHPHAIFIQIIHNCSNPGVPYCLSERSHLDCKSEPSRYSVGYKLLHRDDPKQVFFLYHDMSNDEALLCSRSHKSVHLYIGVLSEVLYQIIIISRYTPGSR